MKTKIRLFKFLAAIAFPIIVMSCSEEDVKITPTPRPNPGTGSSLVQFSASQLTVLENAIANEVVINFDKPALKAGEILIKVTSQSLDQFTTTPAIVDSKIKLAVSTGQSLVQFSVKPTNNALLDGDKNIVFTIESATEGFTLGETKVLTTTLKDDESPAAVNFMLNIGSTRENSAEGSTVMLVLSHAAPGEGSIELSFAASGAVYGTDYVTEPASSNGRLSLPIPAGADKVSFKVLPLNNSIINGERTIAYNLAGAQGSVILGSALTHELLITDDELYGLPKSYTIAAGNGWSYKKSYEYDEQGRISKVVTQQNALLITQTYHYNAAGMLTKITESDFSEINYLYDNDGRVIKSEKYKDGVLKSYNMYGYDPAGNVGEVAAFYRIPSGELVLSMVFVYLYYDNGNLYKRMVYNPNQETGELAEVSVETYDGYIERENPFPVYELIPGVSAQPWLPTSYQYANGETALSYSFTYEYDEAGRMIKRNVLMNGAIVETNRYEYY